MDFIDAGALTGRVWMMFGVIVILGYLFYDTYKRFWLTLLLLIAGLGGVAYHQDVITDASIAGVKGAVMDSAEGASNRAKAIGSQRYRTSGGEGGETNKAYRKNVDEEAIE